MNVFNIIILLFLLAAFSIGVGLTDIDRVEVDNALDKPLEVINNISFEYHGTNESNISSMKGIYSVLEHYVKFVMTFAIEVLRTGVYFGQENPDYFEPDFIIKIVKLIIVLIIITLLIKPVTYLLVAIILLMIYIKDKLKERKKRREGKEIGKRRRWFKGKNGEVFKE